jgi:hypothetical protein
MSSSKFAAAAVLLAAAFGAQAQTIETDYPAVTDNNTPAIANQSVAKSAPSAAPFLVQSNFEGVKLNPAYAQPSALTREEVRAGATIIVLPPTGNNA